MHLQRPLRNVKDELLKVKDDCNLYVYMCLSQFGVLRKVKVKQILLNNICKIMSRVSYKVTNLYSAI